MGILKELSSFRLDHSRVVIMPGVAKSALQGDLTMPSQWRAVGEVSKLNIFPVKSLAHVEVDNFDPGTFGAESGSMVDRQFVVLDKKDKVYNIQEVPNHVPH
eukprot:TRINITY_DN17081_c0_g1_i1.p2 TRINITY_DN17081_c0_g1~~TRINITY_DN17081_c0_g1_i1.p2  ORF type:complete len:117 (+),score=48.97 TRINITY_DN17081_c0_g1_i1:48-353(+)